MATCTCKDNSDTSLSIIYYKIPLMYMPAYQQILQLFADYGVELMEDCKTPCKNSTNTILQCYNMFLSAVAAYNAGNTKLANLLYKYICAKLKQVYGVQLKQYDNYLYTVDEENGQYIYIISNDPLQYCIIDNNKNNKYDESLKNCDCGGDDCTCFKIVQLSEKEWNILTNNGTDFSQLQPNTKYIIYYDNDNEDDNPTDTGLWTVEDDTLISLHKSEYPNVENNNLSVGIFYEDIDTTNNTLTL